MKLALTVNIKNLHLTPILGAGDAAPSAAKDTGAVVLRRVRLDAAWNRLTDGDPSPHVAVLDESTGLLWSTTSLGRDGEGMSQADCAAACAALDLLGQTDWRLPTRAELATLIDDTRHEPAIDTSLFPGVKPAWHWTSTPAAWSSASAWGVYFSSGYVGSIHRGSGFALAVRRVGQ